MSRSYVQWIACIGVLVGVLSAPLAASSSGELMLSWTPPSDLSQINGYRVYYSPVSNAYDDMPSVEVPNSSINSVRILGLDDCRRWYFVVRSYNSVGESENSIEVNGWPRPRFDPIALPHIIGQGQTTQFQLTGANYQAGDTCRVNGMECELSVGNCQTAVASVTAPAAIQPGLFALTVKHAGSSVEGVLQDALQVLDSEAPPDGEENAPPTVVFVAPGLGASTALVDVRPVVWFSEAVSIEQAVIELRDPWGGGIPIEIRQVDGSRIELLPQVILEYGTSYTFEIRDVSDVAGAVQTNPVVHEFTTELDPATTTLGTPAISFAGASNEDIVWAPNPGAQFYEVWRCIGSSCWLAQNSESRFPSVFDRSRALNATHHVGLDGEFLPAAELVLEFVNIRRKYGYRVRACKIANGLQECGSFSNTLNYRGRQFMCVEDEAEIPCYPGAPLTFQ